MKITSTILFSLFSQATRVKNICSLKVHVHHMGLMKNRATSSRNAMKRDLIQCTTWIEIFATSFRTVDIHVCDMHLRELHRAANRDFIESGWSQDLYPLPASSLPLSSSSSATFLLELYTYIYTRSQIIVTSFLALCCYS